GNAEERRHAVWTHGAKTIVLQTGDAELAADPHGAVLSGDDFGHADFESVGGTEHARRRSALARHAPVGEPEPHRSGRIGCRELRCRQSAEIEGPAPHAVPQAIEAEAPE